MYVSPFGDVIRKHGINFHMYADDVQLYVSFRPCDQKKTLHELQHCLDDVHSWLRENRLLLNGNKTKMITFGTKQRLTVATNIHVTVDGCLISPDICLHDIAPQYIAEMLTTHAVTRSLRSTDKQLLVVPRSKLKRHGDRSFNVVAPVLWNSLPECMKSSSSVASFKRTLKTFLFRQEYGVIN